LLALLPAAAQALLHTHDARPAATLLLPYFEIDPIPNFPESQSIQHVAVAKTVFTVGNATQFPVRTRVTLWTDFGIPTLTFHLNLTGYDVETIDLKQTFDGILPQQGAGPGECATDSVTRLPPNVIIGLRNAHTGQSSSLFGGLCGSRDHGDGALRGFVTIDAVTTCDDTLLSNDPGYSAILDPSNALWGRWELFDPPQNASDAGTMVHVESGSFAADEHTFYGRFNGFNGADGREALGNVWGIRYNNGGLFDGGTSLRVWREPRSTPVPVTCPAGLPGSQPGAAAEILAFDEAEEVVAIVPAQPVFPLVAQRVQVKSSGFPVPFDFGWLLLNLNSAAGLTKNELKQSYVSAVHDALGRFSAGSDAFRMAHPTTARFRNPQPNSGLVPGFPGVSVTKDVSGTLQVGQNITYTITITRQETAEPFCNLTDVLPAFRLTLQSATASSGMVNANTMTNTVTWSGMLDDATPSATIDIVATIISAGGVSNQAQVMFDANGDAVPDGTASAFRFFNAAP
jgi:hypothetical protein